MFSDGFQFVVNILPPMVGALVALIALNWGLDLLLKFFRKGVTR